MDNNHENGSNGEYEVYNNHHESTVTECLGGDWRLQIGRQIIFPGDTISWNAKHSAILFALPIDSKKYFALEKGEFEEIDDSKRWPYKDREGMSESTTCVQYVEKGDSLTLEVREDCFNSDEETSPGDKVTVVYDIFVLDDDDHDEEFVKGNSSPEMIIQRPYKR